MSHQQKLRNFCLTSFDTKKHNAWIELNDDRIRLLSWQLEQTPAGKVHLQGYLETYEPISFPQVKKMLDDHQVHIEQRNGPRLSAYMYTKKENDPWWDTKYPQWIHHGKRIPGTEHKQLGVFSNRQGERTHVQKVVDMVEDGKTETDIAMECPREFIKFHNGIQKLLAVRARRFRGKYRDIKVIVRWGDTRTNKTGKAKEEHGWQNVFEPIWNGSKFWFDGYQGEPILQLNEVDKIGWSLDYFQRLCDHWVQPIEYKGGVTAGNWHTIILTSNVPPNHWWDHYAGCTQKQIDSVITRITKVEKMLRPPGKRTKTWADLGVTESSITSVTSVPQFIEPFYHQKWQVLDGNAGIGEADAAAGASPIKRSTLWSKRG